MPSPSIGVAIPVFGHPRLVAEAIASVGAQQFEGRITTVVVIDGDPHQEVLDVINSMRASTPLHAVFRKNGRLPAARNTGIEFLLKLEPDLDAVYLLDADNRLSPHSIARFWSVLEAHPEAGWAYPDIGFFGLTWSQSGIDPRQTAPHYSVFRHLMGNICEAGSMVRGSLLRSGLRYDESFNVGYEDWEFWLQCLGAGHVGTPVTNSGFFYRRRTDSMLAEADRHSDAIKAKMRAKHARLFTPKFVTGAYLAECSPLLRLQRDGGMQLLAADGTMHAERQAAVEALFAQARTHFHLTYLPRFVIVPFSGATEEVRPGLAATLALLSREKDRKIERVSPGLAPAGPTDAAACAWVVPLDQVEGAGEVLPDADQRLLAPLLPLLGILRLPSDLQDARYGGPPSYRVDRFILEAQRGLDGDGSSGPDARPQAPHRTRAVDPLHRWQSNWLTAGRTRPRHASDGTAYPDIQPNLMYLGQIFAYEPPAPDREPAPPAASVSLLIEEWRLLPFSRFLFGAGGAKLYYVCTEAPDAGELTSIQCSEHALAGIFCRDADRPLIEALSVPIHKLMSPTEFAELLH